MMSSSQPQDSDEDIDCLLAGLTADEVAELEGELVTVYEDPTVPVGLRQRNQTDKKASIKYNRAAMLDFCEKETKKLIEREMSIEEGEPSADGRNLDVTSKMGCDDTFAVTSDDHSAPNTHPPPASDVHRKETPEDKGEELESEHIEDAGVEGLAQGSDGGGSLSGGLIDVEGQDVKREGEEVRKDKEGEGEVTEKREEHVKKEKGGSRTHNLISKLQRKGDSKAEKDAKEDNRKAADCKTKALISKLQGQGEKEDKRSMDNKDKRQRSKDSKMRGLFSNKDKQSELKASAMAKDREGDKRYHKGNADDSHQKINRLQQGRSREKATVTSKTSDTDINAKPIISDSREEDARDENEDKASSMFDELIDRVRGNDPSLTELNVNNSDAIKTQTLIQLAEALRANIHVRTLALANTRADDRVAYAVADTLHSNTCLASINLDSNHLTGKGILALIHAIEHSTTVTELRFHNQRHMCGGKTEMEMASMLRNNSTLLKLGYHFELAGPRITLTNILSQNMDLQRQRRMLEKKQAELAHLAQCPSASSSQQTHPSGPATQKGTPDVPQVGKKKSLFPLFKEKGHGGKSPPKGSSIEPSPGPSKKGTSKVKGGQPDFEEVSTPPTSPSPAPVLAGTSSWKALTPVSNRKSDGQTDRPTGGRSSTEQLLDTIRNRTLKVFKKVDVPKRLR